MDLLYSIAQAGSGALCTEQAGRGWAGLAGLGWAGWLAGLQEGANQRGKSFRTLRLRPAGWGPQPTNRRRRHNNTITMDI